jgi:hypothetical protein
MDEYGQLRSIHNPNKCLQVNQVDYTLVIGSCDDSGSDVNNLFIYKPYYKKLSWKKTTSLVATVQNAKLTDGSKVMMTKWMNEASQWWVLRLSDPTSSPSTNPSVRPSEVPTLRPTSKPSIVPTSNPSYSPTSLQSHKSSIVPTSNPSVLPSLRLTTKPSSVPSYIPSKLPSLSPTSLPTFKPISSSYELRYSISSSDGYWCLEVIDDQLASPILLQKCQQSNRQTWTMDQYGQLHYSPNPQRCMQVNQSNSLVLGECHESGENSNNLFTYKPFFQKLTWTAKNSFAVTIQDVSPTKGSKVIISKWMSEANQLWIMDVAPPTSSPSDRPSVLPTLSLLEIVPTPSPTKEVCSDNLKRLFFFKQVTKSNGNTVIMK